MSINSVSPVEKINPGLTAGVSAADDAAAASSEEPIPLPALPVQPVQSVPRVQPVLNGDLRLRFVVDPQTQEVTILMIDRATKKVVRAIPPSELARLKEGDLVDLLS
ncbi:MAG: flagellar protein FlaG [Anaerolineaceae bacterium]|nr:flagellar protein FlaG [Anaerolineaceae bacterium]